MTKKNLTWKLKDLPSAGEIADLVKSGIIDKDEAREIVFGTVENDKEKIEALEKMITFLQGLVEELAKNKGGTTFVPYTQTVYIDKPIRRYWEPLWTNTTKVLSNSGLKVDTVSSGTMTYSSNVDNKVTSGSQDILTMSVTSSADKTVS